MEQKARTQPNEMVKRRVFTASYTLAGLGSGGVRGRSGSLGCEMG